MFVGVCVLEPVWLAVLLPVRVLLGVLVGVSVLEGVCEGVEVWLAVLEPVRLCVGVQLGVGVWLAVRDAVCEEDGVPVLLELGVPVREEEGVSVWVGVCDGVPLLLTEAVDVLLLVLDLVAVVEGVVVRVELKLLLPLCVTHVTVGVWDPVCVWEALRVCVGVTGGVGDADKDTRVADALVEEVALNVGVALVEPVEDTEDVALRVGVPLQLGSARPPVPPLPDPLPLPLLLVKLKWLTLWWTTVTFTTTT